MAETTVFQSGNSQAVRLPKEYRFSSKTVEIFRRGNEVVLREKKRTLAEALATLPPISEAEIAELDSVMSEVRAQPKIQERDWTKLGRSGKATSKSTRKPR